MQQEVEQLQLDLAVPEPCPRCGRAPHGQVGLAYWNAVGCDEMFEGACGCIGIVQCCECEGRSSRCWPLHYLMVLWHSSQSFRVRTCAEHASQDTFFVPSLEEYDSLVPIAQELFRREDGWLDPDEDFEWLHMLQVQADLRSRS